jgi:hypothetical protein
MLGEIEAVARLVGEVYTADEGDTVVDDDRLLVVAVQGPLLRVEGALDLGAADELFPHRSNLPTGRPEEGKRSPGPDEHSDVDPLGELGEHAPEDRRLGVPGQCEVRREVPSGEMDVRRGVTDFLGDPGKRNCAVDQDFELVARPRRRIPMSPATLGGIQRMFPANAPKPAPVVRSYGAVDGLPDLPVEFVEEFMS